MPWLILFACGLMALQPRLTRTMARRRHQGAEHPLVLAVGVFLTGIYGGYFGAAQGVILIALLSIFLVDDLQRLNGLKNVLAALINGVAAILFMLAGPVDYRVVVLLAIGSIVGGQVGAYVGRRLPASVYRVGRRQRGHRGGTSPAAGLATTTTGARRPMTIGLSRCVDAPPTLHRTQPLRSVTNVYAPIDPEQDGMEDILRSLGAVLDTQMARAIEIRQRPDGLAIRALAVADITARLDGAWSRLEHVVTHVDLARTRVRRGGA